MDSNDSMPTGKRILYACLAGLLIIALILVVGFGIKHHNDNLEAQMVHRTWTMHMLYDGKNIYKKNSNFCTNDGTGAKLYPYGSAKALPVPIHFYNSSKDLEIGNKSHGEILHATSNTRSDHYFVVHKVFNNGLVLHKHMHFIKRHMAINFTRNN